MRFAAILLFFLLTGSSFAQLEKGPGQSSENLFFDRILGEDADFFYVLKFEVRNTGRIYFLEQYSKATLEKRRTMKLGQYMMEDEINVGRDVIKPYDRVLVYTGIFNGNLYVFFKYYDPIKHRINFKADVVSLEEASIIDENHLLAELPSYGADITEKEFIVSPSYNGTSFLVVTRSSLHFHTKQLAFAQLLSSAKFKRIWARQLLSEYAGSPVYTRCYQLDTEGNFYYYFAYKRDTTEKVYSRSAISIKQKYTPRETALPLEIDTNTNIRIYNPSLQYNSTDDNIYFTGCFHNAGGAEGQKEGVVHAMILPGTLAFQYLNMISIAPQHQKAIDCNKADEHSEAMELAEPGVKKVGDTAFLYTYVSKHYLKNYSPVHASGHILVIKRDNYGNTYWQRMIPHAASYGYTSDNLDPTRIQATVKDKNLYFLMAESRLNNVADDSAGVDFCKLNMISSLADSQLQSTSIDLCGNISRTVYHSNSTELADAGTKWIETPKGLILRYKAGQKEGFGRIIIK